MNWIARGHLAVNIKDQVRDQQFCGQHGGLLFQDHRKIIGFLVQCKHGPVGRLVLLNIRGKDKALLRSMILKLLPGGKELRVKVKFVHNLIGFYVVSTWKQCVLSSAALQVYMLRGESPSRAWIFLRSWTV